MKMVALNRRTILGVILTFTLMLSMVPGAARADDVDAKPIEAAEIEVAPSTEVDNDAVSEPSVDDEVEGTDLAVSEPDALVVADSAMTTSSTSAEEFKFEVSVANDGDTFRIPTSSQLNPSGGDSRDRTKAYDWIIDWGEAAGSPEHVQGVQDPATHDQGIAHSYAQAGTYTITIKPGGSEEAWLAAFGFTGIGTNANSQENRDMVTKVVSPITPLMTRTAAQVAGTVAAPSYEWYEGFSDCTNLTMGEGFTFDQAAWQGIADAGHVFASYLFSGCEGSDFTMGPSFNLPSGFMEAGDGFAVGMFSGCSGDAFTMNDEFNLPQGMVAAGDSFAVNMFRNCSGPAFTMNDTFNLPQGMTVLGYGFASFLFENCSGDAFAMNGLFNLPQGITEVDSWFAIFMFAECSGARFTMNEVFNLPQGITKVSESFATNMFASCSGAAFTMNRVFNLPQGITDYGETFAWRLFRGAGGPSFQVNDVFRFPVLDAVSLDTVYVFEETFADMAASTPRQSRMAHSIINENAVPVDARKTFSGSACFADLDYIPQNWGGGGQAAKVTVSFIAWGFSGEAPVPFPASQIIDPGSKAVEPADPAIAGHAFAGWYDDAACTIPYDFGKAVDQSRYIYAKWIPAYTIIASAGPGGAIDPRGEVAVAEGASQTFALTPDAGFRIADVVVDGVSVGAVPSYTFDNVSASHLIDVRFEKLPVDPQALAKTGDGMHAASGLIAVAAIALLGVSICSYRRIRYE